VSNYSTHPTLVEYAVHSLFKGQSPKRAAATTAKKHHGSTNIFVGSGDAIEIDPVELEEAIWNRLIDYTLVGMSHIKEGKEHYALDGCALNFNQKPKKFRDELKERVVEKLGSNPFKDDHGSL
jgi:hypothetical protein